LADSFVYAIVKAELVAPICQDCIKNRTIFGAHHDVERR